MPLLDFNDPAVWDSLYNVYDRNAAGQIIGFKHYERSVRDRIVGPGADLLIAALTTKGLQPGQRIVLVGAGFGWITERFLELGYGPLADGTGNGKLCAVETSTYIQQRKAANAVVPILDADVNASTGRRTIRQQFGSNNAAVDWIISEDVLPGLIGNDTGTGNNEIAPFCSALRQLAPNVAHLVTVTTPGGNQDPRLNWKSAATWKSLVSPDWIVPAGSSTVL